MTYKIKSATIGMVMTLNNVLNTLPLVQHVSSAPCSVASNTTMLPTGIASIKMKTPAISGKNAKLRIINAATIGITNKRIAKNRYIFTSIKSCLKFCCAMDAPIKIMDIGITGSPK